MRHWLHIGTRNWRAKPGRTAGAVAAIALGVGVVVWVSCAYESVRAALQDQVSFWIGNSDLAVESVYGAEGTVFQSIASQAQALENVEAVTYRLKHRLVFRRPSTDPLDGVVKLQEVQAVGIDPGTEYELYNYPDNRVEGRLLRVGDTNEAVVERRFATEQRLRIGDTFVLSRRDDDSSPGSKTREYTLEIVGILEHQRIARQQLPMVMLVLERVQELAGFHSEPRRVTKIDIKLKDDTTRVLRQTEFKLQQIVKPHEQNFLVSSSERKATHVRMAEQQSGFALLLISSVALFTGFFVILSTLSMSVTERVGQLGMLRCLGTTRLQLAAIVMSEAIPIALVGLAAGVPVGLAMTQLTVQLVPEYVGTIIISEKGVLLALVGGALTTLAGALVPMIQAMGLSPLVASRPEGRATRPILAYIAFVAGCGMLIGHWFHLTRLPIREWFVTPLHAVSSVMLIYCGYALITPVVMMVVGWPAMVVVSAVTGVREKLLRDQIGRTTWRSSVICSGLMVGLSLIVTIVVQSKSISGAWDFPKRFCEAFVFVSPPVAEARAKEAIAIPGVGEHCLVNISTKCSIITGGPFSWPVSSFVAANPREFFDVAELEFLEGDKEEAIAKLERGGHILVTPQFVDAQRAGYGDDVRIRMGFSLSAKKFTIAGVIESPALDIAANYFNAGGMLVQASVHSVFGTPADLEAKFDMPSKTSMYLINFDLEATEPPPAFLADAPPDIRVPQALAEQIVTWRGHMPERSADVDRIAEALQRQSPLYWKDVPELSVVRSSLQSELGSDWGTLTPDQRWVRFREDLVLRYVAMRSGYEFFQHASVSALKERIDRDMRKATLVITAVPTVALIIAALGVGNLMMANVASRSRQLAILRALGATKWQVTRLIIAEALVLGVLGSVIGVTLGYHGSFGMSYLTGKIYGYHLEPSIPWDWVGSGIVFTIGICLIAGIIPARRAARTNIVASLQTT